MIGAIDIGGTKIAIGAVGAEGNPLLLGRLDTQSGSAAEVLAEASRQLRDGVRTKALPLDGIGIACTGPIDPATGIVGNVDLLPGWEGTDLRLFFREEFGVRVTVENDADAAALGEFRWGAGAGASRFLYVTVSTGIGGAAILDGELYRGAGGAHPEIGHHALDASGPRCYCGMDGCWESLASGPALARWFAAQLPPVERTGANAAAICDLARQGNRIAGRAVERTARYLGLGLANLVTLFCPDVIALGGGLMHSADLFLEPAKALVARSCGLVPANRCRIQLAQLGPGAALVGAAQAWHHRYGNEASTGT